MVHVDCHVKLTCSIFLFLFMHTVVGIADKKNVFRELKPIANCSHKIGLGLDIENSRLEIIKHDYHRSYDQLSATLSLWLRGNGGEASWNFLCEALRSPLIANDAIADNITEKYLNELDTVSLGVKSKTTCMNYPYNAGISASLTTYYRYLEHKIIPIVCIQFFFQLKH